MDDHTPLSSAFKCGDVAQSSHTGEHRNMGTGTDDVDMVQWGEIPSSHVKDSCSEQVNEEMDQAEFVARGVGLIELGFSREAASDDGQKLNQMIDSVAKSDGHFKHQQRGEPDLTYEEKCDIARKLYNDRPDQFLARFGKYLSAEDLQLFKHLESDYAVSFYISEVKCLLDSKQAQTNVKNRRYQAMLRMTSEGAYFTDEEMKERAPLLYEQMVGQFVTEEEANDQVQQEMNRGDLRFSTILMSHMQWNETNQLYKAEKDNEEAQEEESDEDEEEDEEQGQENPEWVPSERERRMMHQEFLNTMQERFMSGKDKLFFNYSTVDENADYDNLEIRGHDEEDKYFAEEEPEDIDDGMECSEFDDTDLKMPVRKEKLTDTTSNVIVSNELPCSSQSQEGPS